MVEFLTIVLIIFVLEIINGLAVDKYKVQEGIVQENFQENVVKNLQFTKRPSFLECSFYCKMDNSCTAFSTTDTSCKLADASKIYTGLTGAQMTDGVFVDWTIKVGPEPPTTTTTTTTSTTTTTTTTTTTIEPCTGTCGWQRGCEILDGNEYIVNSIQDRQQCIDHCLAVGGNVNGVNFSDTKLECFCVRDLVSLKVDPIWDTMFFNNCMD